MAGPLGDERLDHLFAMLQATIANVNRGKRQKPYTPDQFMPKWGRAKELPAGGLDGYALLDKVKKLNKQMGGRERVDARGPADSDRN